MVGRSVITELCWFNGLAASGVGRLAGRQSSRNGGISNDEIFILILLPFDFLLLTALTLTEIAYSSL